MEKKYLKKMLKGLSIAGLVAGMTGVAMGAGGWSGTKKGAVSTQVKQEAPAPGYGAEAAKEAAPGYGTPAPGYGEEKKEAAAKIWWFLPQSEQGRGTGKTSKKTIIRYQI